MDQIAAGESTKDEVLADSRRAASHDLRRDRRQQRRAGQGRLEGDGRRQAARPLHVCEREGRKKEDGSPNQLRIIDTKGGKRFVGCQGWRRSDPDDPKSEPAADACTFSRPLPGRNFQLWKIAERCPTCGEMPRLRVQGFRSRPWELCLNEDCPDMVKMREQRAERMPPARPATPPRRTATGMAPRPLSPMVRPRRRRRGGRARSPRRRPGASSAQGPRPAPAAAEPCS